jgi:transcriptional regulator with XRE-family HTH domain
VPFRIQTVFDIMPDTMSIGERLRRARIEAGVSQASLARRAGTSQAAISRIERGVEQPTSRRVEQLLSCLGLRLEQELRPLAQHREEPRRVLEAASLSAEERLARGFGATHLTREILGTAARAGG